MLLLILIPILHVLMLIPMLLLTAILIYLLMIMLKIANSKLCMDHRNKIKVPDPVVKDLTSKK